MRKNAREVRNPDIAKRFSLTNQPESTALMHHRYTLEVGMSNCAGYSSPDVDTDHIIVNISIKKGRLWFRETVDSGNCSLSSVLPLLFCYR